ncbi:UNVERIFIED_CONTAM: hypothetical protein HHA_257580 [Hammondia hammondi]|eukprot:XP_008883227.1 hypothetical protein HHA_257580 [Hammondia hammondi]
MGSASPRHSPSGRGSFTHDVSPPCEQDADVPPVSSPHHPFVEGQLRPSPPQPSASPPHTSFPASSPASSSSSSSSSSSLSSSSSSPLPSSSSSTTAVASFAPPPPLSSASVSCPFASSASSSSPSSSSSSAAVSAPCALPLCPSSSALSSSFSSSAAASAPSSASLSASAFLSSLSSPSSFFPSSFSSPSSFVSRRGRPVRGAPSELGVEMLLAGDSPSDSSTADESDVASTAPSVSLLQHSHVSLSSAAAFHCLSPRTSSTPPTVGNRSLEGSLDNPSMSERGDASERERDGEERGWGGRVEEREGRRGRKGGKRGRSNSSLFLSPSFRAGRAQGASVGRNAGATAWRERDGQTCTFNAPVPLSASAFLRGVVTPPPLRAVGIGEVDERNRLPSRFSSSSSSPCRSPVPFSPPSHLSSPGGHACGEATSGEAGLSDSRGSRRDRVRRCRVQGKTERRTHGDSCGASLSEGSSDGGTSLSSSNARSAQRVADAGKREEDEGELEKRSWESRRRGRQRGGEEAKKHDDRGGETTRKEQRHSDGQEGENIDGRGAHCAGLATRDEAEGIARGGTRQTQAEAPNEDTGQHPWKEPTGGDNLEAEGRQKAFHRENGKSSESDAESVESSLLGEAALLHPSEKNEAPQNHGPETRGRKSRDARRPRAEAKAHTKGSHGGAQKGRKARRKKAWACRAFRSSGRCFVSLLEKEELAIKFGREPVIFNFSQSEVSQLLSLPLHILALEQPLTLLPVSWTSVETNDVHLWRYVHLYVCMQIEMWKSTDRERRSDVLFR